eukprot:10311603-Alexandrium_andersonii.AAC.1
MSTRLPCTGSPVGSPSVSPYGQSVPSAASSARPSGGRQAELGRSSWPVVLCRLCPLPSDWGL